MIRSHTGEAFTTISSTYITSYYKFLEREETFNSIWLSCFLVETKVILRSCWQDPSKFRIKVDQLYRKKGLRKVYQLSDAMMNQLYGIADIDTFLRTWVPIMCIIATRGTIINWESILASTLKTNIHATKNLEVDQTSKFYMES